MKRILLSAAVLMAGILLSDSLHAQTALDAIVNANANVPTVDVSPASIINGSVPVSDVAFGQYLVGAGVRPATGGVYALGYDPADHTAELYRIGYSGATYTAGTVGGTLTGIDLGSANDEVVNFIFTADNQVIVTGSNGSTYVMNADNGAITDPTAIATTTSGNDDLLVYPNPVVSSTRIVLDEYSTGPVTVDVINMNGQVDRSFQYAPGSYQLDVDMSNLPTGLYSVRVSGKDIGYHNLKVIKE